MIDSYQQERNSDCETLRIDTTAIMMLGPITRYPRRFLLPFSPRLVAIIYVKRIVTYKTCIKRTVKVLLEKGIRTFIFFQMNFLGIRWKTKSLSQILDYETKKKMFIGLFPLSRHLCILRIKIRFCSNWSFH